MISRAEGDLIPTLLMVLVLDDQMISFLLIKTNRQGIMGDQAVQIREIAMEEAKMAILEIDQIMDKIQIKISITIQIMIKTQTPPKIMINQDVKGKGQANGTILKIRMQQQLRKVV